MLPDADIALLKDHWTVGEPPEELYLRIRVATALPQRQRFSARLHAFFAPLVVQRPMAFATQGAVLAVCALVGLYLGQGSAVESLDINSLVMADSGYSEGL